MKEQENTRAATPRSLCEVCGRERRAVTLDELEAILAGRETFDSCGARGSDLCHRLGYERASAALREARRLLGEAEERFVADGYPRFHKGIVEEIRAFLGEQNGKG